jgi:predicted phosphoribosyltransferase
MYFSSRVQAGRMLAAQLKDKYRYENCAVVALSEGGVVVGAQIAIELHAVLAMLLAEEIRLPREPEAIAGISQTGAFSFNDEYSAGEIEEISGEYRNVIEQAKLEKIHELNKLVGEGGVIRNDLLVGRNIILVSDGLKSPFTLDLAFEYLKPIRVEKVVVATPLASVPVVDRIHVLADEVACLSVVEDYMDTEHYYDKQDVPTREQAVEIIEKVILKWK